MLGSSNVKPIHYSRCIFHSICGKPFHFPHWNRLYVKVCIKNVLFPNEPLNVLRLNLSSLWGLTFPSLSFGKEVRLSPPLRHQFRSTLLSLWLPFFNINRRSSSIHRRRCCPRRRQRWSGGKSRQSSNAGLSTFQSAIVSTWVRWFCAWLRYLFRF